MIAATWADGNATFRYFWQVLHTTGVEFQEAIDQVN